MCARGSPSVKNSVLEIAPHEQEYQCVAAAEQEAVVRKVAAVTVFTVNKWGSGSPSVKNSVLETAPHPQENQ